MIQQDRKEKERSEAKNSVEEYIYDMREKLSNEYEKFIVEEVSLFKHSFLSLFFLNKLLKIIIFKEQKHVLEITRRHGIVVVQRRSR